jgi:hypothetical protein
MNRALHQMTDDERERETETIQRILREVQFFEPSEPEPETRQWNVVALVVLTYAGALCFVIGWLVAAWVL